eukprot:8367966-Pyramimonas_sp.AAC.1
MAASITRVSIKDCKAPDYGILRLRPTNHEYLPEHARHFLHWLSQRMDSDDPPIRAYLSAHSWEIEANHNQDWSPIIVFERKSTVSPSQSHLSRWDFCNDR